MSIIKTDQSFSKPESLEEMTPEQWESLCDGCGRCCLEKFEYPESGEVFYTSVACGHLDIETCRCTAYFDRKRRMPKCIALTPKIVRECHWLPKTCAYRLLSEGKDLYDWHPLKSGSPESVHEAGISVRHKVISARYAKRKNLEAYIIEGDI